MTTPKRYVRDDGANMVEFCMRELANGTIEIDPHMAVNEALLHLTRADMVRIVDGSDKR